MSAKPVLPNALVRIASYLDPPRADLAKMALAREQIVSSYGNANFLSWYWHYSNAVGGVTIYVPHSQAEHARQVLTDARARITDILPPWTCSSCGQRVAGVWDACWRCGQFVDGTRTPAEEMAGQPADVETSRWWSGSRLAAAVAGLAMAILILKYGVILLLMLAPIVLIFLLWQFEGSRGRLPESPEAAARVELLPESLRVTRSELSRVIVRRAWQAAMLSIIIFPPLGFYSMRLLWKLADRDTPLSIVDTWRCWAAFLLSIVAILLCVVFAWTLLRAFLSVLT